MTTTTRTTHEEREAAVMADLQTSFPSFADGYLWTKVPDGEDPPDFLADTSLGRVGLELVEWLDGAQMGPAQRRRGDGKKFLNVLTEGWETKYQPSQLSSAVVAPKPGTKVASRDETTLRQEFRRCAEAIDRTWITNRRRIGDSLIADHSSYPVLSRYVEYLRFQSGAQGWKQHGYCWIDIEEQGGAYDPHQVIRTLEQAIEKKINRYSDPRSQARLRAKNLNRLNLLVHGGFNLYAFNTPRGRLSLSEITRAGAAFYTSQPESRRLFDRIWIFNSLNPASDQNEWTGFSRKAGHLRWLAELWPRCRIDPRSIG